MNSSKPKKKAEHEGKSKNGGQEEGYYCIYCGDFVKTGQYHHH
ncbi:MAG: hypothetical protein ACTSVM_01010 [Candidatus Ranarchaeia archaeon]